MRVPWRAREYERTCAECGFVWRVPKVLAHPPKRGMPFLGLGGIGAARETHAVIEANAEMSEQAAEFRRCPQCASAHYRQRSVPVS